MAQTIEVKVPDIGDFDAVPVIEILVADGDTVEVDQPLLVLESDKATMEVPSPAAGTVKGLKVKVGDKVGEGHDGFSRLGCNVCHFCLTHLAPGMSLRSNLPVNPRVGKSKLRIVRRCPHKRLIMKCLASAHESIH